MNMRRRNLLKALGVLGCASIPGRWLPALAASPAADRAADDYCAANTGSRPLFVPAGDGWFGRLAPDGAPLTLRASPIAGTAGPWTQGFAVEQRGARVVTPALTLRADERVRIELEKERR